MSKEWAFLGEWEHGNLMVRAWTYPNDWETDVEVWLDGEYSETITIEF